MRTQRLSAFVFARALLLAVLVAGGASSSAVAADLSAQAYQCFSALKRAMANHDGKTAAWLVSPDTLRLYEHLRELAADSTNADLESLFQTDVHKVIQLRKLLDTSGLQAISGSAFVWAVENKLVDKPALEDFKLDRVQVDGKRAMATLLFNDRPAPLQTVICFEWRDGMWKVCWHEFERAFEAEYAQLRKRAELTKVAFAEIVAETKQKQTAAAALQGPVNGPLPRSNLSRVAIPGVALSFVPTVPMEPAAQFVGFQCPEYQLSMMVLELDLPPGDALAELAKVYTPAMLKTKGVELEKSERIIVSDAPALLLTARQLNQGEMYRKYLLLQPGKTKVAQVMFTLPLARESQWQADVMSMISSVRFESQAGPANIAYDLRLPAEWQLAKQFGVAEMYSPGGQFPVPPGKNGLSVANMQGSIPTAQRDLFLRKANLEAKQYSQIQLLAAKDVEIDGCAANLCYVSAVDNKTRQSVIVQRCIIFLPDTTYLLESHRTAEMTAWQFEEIATSWRLKR